MGGGGDVSLGGYEILFVLDNGLEFCTPPEGRPSIEKNPCKCV